ncbi:MAG: M50 family metallopeptidase [Bacteroidota bacterium]
MKKSVSFLKIAGIGIYVHWTFSLLIIYIIYINARAGLDPVQISWAVFFVLALFLCVILHELGHALTAKRFGIKTQDITMYPIGGVARLERIPEKPMQELLVTIAGPLVNVLIVAILIPFIYGFDLFVPLGAESSIISPENFILNLAILNLWLALFNLIPAFPMDGGRILRALLAMKISRLKATTIAANIGKLLSLGFIVAGFFYNPFLIFIGVFIVLGAQSELELVRNKELASGLTASDAMMSKWTELESSKPLSEAVSMLLQSESKSFLITENGTYVGTLNRDGIIKALRDKGEQIPIGEVCNRDLSYADAKAPLEVLFTRFRDDRIPLVLVVDDGSTIGVVDTENIAELMLVKQARLEQKNA